MLMQKISCAGELFLNMFCFKAESTLKDLYFTLKELCLRLICDAIWLVWKGERYLCSGTSETCVSPRLKPHRELAVNR